MKKVYIFCLCLCFLLVGCKSIRNSIVSIEKTATEGLIDTYTITYNDGSTSIFFVTNGQDGIQGEQGKNGIQGIQGIQGEPGKDGHTPVITIQDGNWYIDGVDTMQKAQGIQGDVGNGISSILKTSTNELVDTYTITFTDGSTSAFTVNNGKDGKDATLWIDEDGYWVINGIKTEYQSEGNADYVLKLLSNYFEVKEDEFFPKYETAINPRWSYTTSIFSGWGGSIGKPESFDAISITVRARAVPITRIKFFLSINDKNGEVILNEVIDVYIDAYESQEIVWKLPNKIENNTENLYLSFNCDQLCDVYSSFDEQNLIPSNQYQAISSYTTKGHLHNFVSQMIEIEGDKCYYLYTKVGVLKDVLVERESKEKNINVFLSKEYYLTINDNFQLFYRGVVQAVNPYNYCISIKCDKGKAYPRYFEWTPTEDEIGSYILEMTIRDDNGYIIGYDETLLKVVKPKEENEMQNVLCIGDSLTANGYWVREAQRRFNESGGKPEGLNLQYLNFIGTQKSVILEQEVYHEGYSGWTWTAFCGENSPFYDEKLKEISFKSYCEKNGFEGIDVVYINLTWNNIGVPFRTDFGINDDQFFYAQKILDKIHEEYPNAKIRCLGIQMPSQNGGTGNDYGATGWYSDGYGTLVTAMRYNACLEKLCNISKYQNFVKYVDVAGQFDTDYNMPSYQKPVNNRNETTEVIGTDGIHPTINGHYQIGDAVFRSLCEVFSEEDNKK